MWVCGLLAVSVEFRDLGWCVRRGFVHATVVEPGDVLDDR